jgi:hypothetical protein
MWPLDLLNLAIIVVIIGGQHPKIPNGLTVIAVFVLMLLMMLLLSIG